VNEFERYRKAYDEMEKDPAVLAARKQAEVLRAKMMEVNELIFDAEKPYWDRMAEAERKIKDIVLAKGESITDYNVQARYTKGYSIISWKKIAEIYNPPVKVIEQYTKVSEPSVSVFILL